MHRRSFISSLVVGPSIFSEAAFAAPKTNTPLKIIIGFAPGGSTDTAARLISDALREKLERTVIVENKPGASGRIAVETAKNAPADGSYLLLAPHGAMTLFPHIYKNLRYDPFKDFASITRVATNDFCVCVDNQSQVKDLKSLKQLAEANDNSVNFGTTGTGSVHHFLGIKVGQLLGIKMNQTPYKGAAPALMDVAGGVLSAAVVTLGDALELHKAGKLKVVATMGPQRTTLLSGVPTMKELGLDLEINGWLGLFMRTGTPEDTLSAIRNAAVGALQLPTIDAKLASIAMQNAPLPPAEVVQLMHRESEMWASAVKTSGFTPES
jgi:tripartite-type tricarboxylate transporter receptor subunit TctC